MSNRKQNLSADRDLPTVNPRQFRIIDLFAVLTLAALLAAMAAPFLRAMPPDKLTMLLIVALCQVVVTGGTMIHAAHRRQQLLDRSGERIGIGYCGAVRWRHWPLFKSILSMVFLAAAQFGVALVFAVVLTGETPVPTFLVYQLQLGYVTGRALSRYMWRVYPSAMEFFANGVAVSGTSFVEWERAEVRRSQFFSDRVVVVMRPEVGSIAGGTIIVQVSDTLRDELLVAGD
jgi:hypothetical protein